ncbi:MAG: hypothetical protein KBF45_00945 [Cyclobacteriaceae bacterium]|jgi:two-component system, sensor histidine kinase PdtaS|nr:hypothetical protein [Cyclobacteriaceae bacterium]
MKVIVLCVLFFLAFYAGGNRADAQSNASKKNGDVDTVRIKQLLARVDTLLSFDTAEGVLIQNYPEAVMIMDGALKMAYQSKNVKILAQSLSKRAKVYWFNGEYPPSIKLNKEAIKLRNTLHDSIGIAENLHSIGMNWYYSAYYDSAIEYYTQSLTIYEQLKQRTKQRKLLNHLALVYYKMNRYDKVIHYTQEAGLLSEFSEHGEPVIEISASKKVYRNDVYYQPILKEQLHMLEQERKGKTDSRDLIRILRNVAFTYQKLKRYDSTFWYFHQANLVARRMGFIPYLMDQGNAFLEAGQPDSAIYFYKEAMVESENRGTQIQLHWAHQMLNDAYSAKKQYDLALHHALISLQFDMRMNNRFSSVNDYIRIATTYLAIGNANEALKNAEAGLQLSKLIKSKGQAGSLYKLMSDVYQDQGNYRLAFEYQRKHETLADSIEMGESDLSLAELQIAYEVNKQESEIGKLHQQNLLNETQIENRNLVVAFSIALLTIITATGIWYYSRYRHKKKLNEQLELQKKTIENQNTELTLQNREKEALLHEIHHRVKNNLQIISSLINLKTRQTSNETALALQQLNGRIFSMGLIHEKLYENENIGTIRMDEYLIELARYLLASIGESEYPVQLKSDCEPIELTVDSVLTCGLISNELLTNSLKYAFAIDQTDREIVLSLKRQNQYIEMYISDNGRRNELTPENFVKSFGLRFVDQLVTAKLGGEWTMRLDNGFHAEIKLPVNK